MKRCACLVDDLGFWPDLIELRETFSGDSTIIDGFLSPFYSSGTISIKGGFRSSFSKFNSDPDDLLETISFWGLSWKNQASGSNSYSTCCIISFCSSFGIDIVFLSKLSLLELVSPNESSFSSLISFNCVGARLVILISSASLLLPVVYLLGESFCSF